MSFVTGTSVLFYIIAVIYLPWLEAVFMSRATDTSLNATLQDQLKIVSKWTVNIWHGSTSTVKYINLQWITTPSVWRARLMIQSKFTLYVNN